MCQQGQLQIEGVNEDGLYPTKTDQNNNKKKNKIFHREKRFFRRPAGADNIPRQDSIGDALAPEDQFYLEIPLKIRNRGGVRLKRKNKNISHDADTTPSLDGTSSTVSSISCASRDKLPAWRIQEASPTITRRGQRHNSNRGGCGGCCGASAMDEGPVVAAGGNGSATGGKQQRHRSRTPIKHPTFFQWLTSCGNTREDTIDGPNTLATVHTYHQRPDNALFDTLEDDDDAGSLIDGNSTDAVEEGNGSVSSRKSVWKRLRSIRGGISTRLRSFKRGRSFIRHGRSAKSKGGSASSTDEDGSNFKNADQSLVA